MANRRGIREMTESEPDEAVRLTAHNRETGIINVLRTRFCQETERRVVFEILKKG